MKYPETSTEKLVDNLESPKPTSHTEKRFAIPTWHNQSRSVINAADNNESITDSPTQPPPLQKPSENNTGPEDVMQVDLVW